MNDSKLKIYEFGEFRVDVPKRLLLKGEGEPIPLTPKVFDTLLHLIRNSGKVVGKDELMREIWTDSVVEENNLNQNISILRRVFGEKPGEQRFIVTVAGHGYRFVPEVRSIPDADISATDGSSGQASSKNPIEETGALLSTIDSIATIDHSRPPKGRWPIIALSVIVLIICSVAAFYLWKEKSASNQESVTTVAVLPFKPLVVQNRNEALELGMADALISKLSAGEELIVRPLSSIRRYGSVEQDAQKAGLELGVGAVVDGTIQNWGDRIRVSAKLIRISDGKQLWGGQFDERFVDIFAVQDSISEKVAAALKVRLSSSEMRHPTGNLEAYQLYMKGRYNIAKGTSADLLTSIPFFEKAIETDPRYALAYTGLSNAYGVLGLSGDTTIPDAVSKARAAERRALELDDTLGEAQITHCMGLFWYDWDWASAEKACVRAIDLDPNNAEFHGHYAMLLSSTGRHDQALAEAKRSRELDPLNLAQSALEGQFLLHAGRVDEALEQLKKTSELEPDFWMPHFYAASALIEKGMFSEAIAASGKEFELSGRNALPLGVYALAKAGSQDAARSALNDLIRRSETDYVSPYGIALVFTALGEQEKAVEWLETAFEKRDPLMTFLKVEPKWKEIRGHPRFIALLNRMKFP